MKIKMIGLFCLIALLINCKTLQDGKNDYDKTMHFFVENYNQGNYENIFIAFSTEMQNVLPSDATETFFDDLKSPAGNIIEWEIMEITQAGFSYKATFERGIFVIDLSVNNLSKISRLKIRPFIENVFPLIERNITPLILPFNDEWYVVWGGDTAELNYHVENTAQKNAFDFVIADENGKTYKTNGLINEDYYAYGKEIIAPCSGEIVFVVDGIKDNEPGKMNPYYVPGNMVIIKTDNEEYMMLAHFKKNSIIVGEGRFVERGDVIGACGNSGNSSEPHLHFHIQNTENMIDATGVKCYFEEITVNGNAKRECSPIKGDKVKNKQRKRKNGA